jgi:hypothetical protein
MRALLSFVPRPRMKTAKTRKQILGGLIDDIQVIAPLEDSELALQVAAEFLHTQRILLLRRVQLLHERTAHADR